MRDAVTACGECCSSCAKYTGGACPGCIAADGCVPEWAQSGRCRIHACAKAHGVSFCGSCPAFPCGQLRDMMPWKENPEEEIRRAARRMATTLFVSDLDGTLLRSDQRTSAYTNETINRLVGQGMHFTYATARSYHTASKATAGVNASIPVIVYNGAFVVENGTGRVLKGNFFAKDEAEEILAALLGAGVQPIVYSVADGRERMSYIREKLHPGAAAFMDTRKGDVRDTPVAQEKQLYAGDSFYFTCIDTPQKLQPLHERFRNEHRCVFSRDIYSDTQWLEIMPRKATKANAAVQLAKLLGCERIVAFGDHVNDLDLFAVADESYAVGNAVPELKAAATAVIGANDEDGVARWLDDHIT